MAALALQTLSVSTSLEHQRLQHNALSFFGSGAAYVPASTVTVSTSTKTTFNDTRAPSAPSSPFVSSGFTVLGASSLTNVPFEPSPEIGGTKALTVPLGLSAPSTTAAGTASSSSDSSKKKKAKGKGKEEAGPSDSQPSSAKLIAKRTAWERFADVTAIQGFDAAPWTVVREVSFADLFSVIPFEAGTVKCQVFRDKGTLATSYTMHFEGSNAHLMTARKRLKTRTPSFIISRGDGETTRKSDDYIGKLRSNFAGTDWYMYTATEERSDRHQVGGVNYAVNPIGTKGPRVMKVYLPKVSAANRPAAWLAADDDETLQESKGLAQREMTLLENRQPVFDENTGMYSLNFSRRVTKPSVKNFQVVSQEDPDIILLQFGKCGDDFFTLDFSYPFSPFVALCTAIASCERKTFVE